MEKISREVAVIEFNKWLDFKKVKTSKREESKEQGEHIISAISEGFITVDDQCNLIQTLEHPITNKDGETTFSELKYKPRISVKQLNIKLKGCKADDVDGRVLAYAGALTDENTSIIGCLDTEDYRITSNIVMYFL